MIDPKQIRELVIRPVLRDLNMWHPDSEELMMGTAAQESGMGRWIRQMGGGPALGLFQMEPLTHDDIWKTWLARRPDLARKVRGFEIPELYDHDNAQEMVGNLYYATAMARVHYWRRPEPLPAADDLRGQAAYWKKFFNTSMGHGTEEEYITNYRRIVR